MNGATIVDVFVTGSQIAIYTRNEDGVEALAMFFVDDPEVRERIALALAPGANIDEAISAPL